MAAINTGNNLLYLLSAMLLGLIVVSGILSEQGMRGLRVGALLPGELFAGRPALCGATLRNGKRHLSSHSIALEVPDPAGSARVLYVPRLVPGEARLLSWEVALPARGRQRLPGIRVITRFPFGLFVKSGRVVLDAEVLVFPAVHPMSGARLREMGGMDVARSRRRGRGDELHLLRDYRAGDDPRLIHWRSSARAGTLTVRELEGETTIDARIVLEDSGQGPATALEAGLSEAASLAVHLLRAGAAVELAGPGTSVSPGQGPAQTRRILTALALYARPAAGRFAAVPARRSGRDIRVSLG
ncbi:MAG: DUF58 domain-containing protein [Candidatus Rokubacteria bacterium]|nr:DUF58 domain-containing protein [Candidatus Rokubacteria bacterium]